MLRYDHIDINYPDFIYRFEDFFKIVDNQKLTKIDAILLYSLVRGIKPNRVLEVGRSSGTSTMVICGALSDSDRGHLDSVDIADGLNNEVRDLISARATNYILDSKNLLDHPVIKNQKYQMFFIDGDHSLEYQISDIESCLWLSDDSAWFVLHDADLPETREAVEISCKKHPQLIDNGCFGDQLYLLKKKK